MELTIKNQSKGINLIILFLFIMMFFSTFNGASPNLKVIGFISLFITLLSTLFLTLYHFSTKGEIYKTHLKIIVPALTMFLIMLVGLYNNYTSDAFIVIFQFVTLISFFIFSSLIRWDNHKFKLAQNLSIIFIVFLPIFADTDFIGAYMILPLFFAFVVKRRSFLRFIIILSSLSLIYAAGMRAVFLLLLSAFVTYIFWSFISKSLFRYILFFGTVISGLLAIIFIYPKLIYWHKYYELEYFVRQYTGKNLMSGRNRLWETLTDIINLKPFLGHGTGISPSDVTTINLSAHNLYLQTALQNGWIGLSVLIILFFVIWLIYYKSKRQRSTRLSASFFIGILVYQSFEVVLTQNKTDTALLFWLIISIGVSNSIFNKTGGGS